MKITEISVIPLGYLKDFPRIPRSFAIVRVRTDEGVVGYGEASSSYGHSYPDVIKTIIDSVLSRILIGEDPREIDALLLKMQKYTWPYLGWNGVANSAIGAIEIALWDILGKVAGKPIYQLLNATRKSILLYGTGTTYFEMTPAWHAAFMDRAMRQDFQAIKVRVANNATWDVDVVRTVREHIGPDIKLMVDAYMSYSMDQALNMIERFREYDIYFMEEPISFFRLEEMAMVTEKSLVPIAIGERIFSVFGFEEIVKWKAASILQPDATIVGGIKAFNEVCELAKANGLEVCPHIGGLTAIGIAANLHASVSNDNCTFVEYDLGPYQPLRDDLIQEPIFAIESVSGGKLCVPEGPGLGINVDEEKFLKYQYKAGAVYPDVYPHYGFSFSKG